MRWAAVLVALVLLVGSGCADSSNEVVSHGAARTYFEALDLSTPTAAAETFLDAFARDDFMTVFLAFHPSAQSAVLYARDSLQWHVVIDREALPRDALMEVLRSFPPESIGVWYLFDALMLAADEHDAFVIDLTGPARIVDETVVGDEAEVSAEVAGIAGPVTLHMAKSLKGSWRVFDVTVGGEGDPVVWPGSGPN